MVNYRKIVDKFYHEYKVYRMSARISFLRTEISRVSKRDGDVKMHHAAGHGHMYFTTA